MASVGIPRVRGRGRRRKTVSQTVLQGTVITNLQHLSVRKEQGSNSTKPKRSVLLDFCGSKKKDSKFVSQRMDVVLRFLDANSLLSCGTTCRAAKKVCDENYLWQNLCRNKSFDDGLSWSTFGVYMLVA